MKRSCQSISATIAAFFAGQTTASGDFFEALLPHAANIVAGDNPIPVLAELQLSGCAITDDDRSHLLAAVRAVELSLAQLNPEPADVDTLNHRHTVGDVLQLQHPDEAQRRLLIIQVHHRLLGLLYGILAASQLPRTEGLSASNGTDDWVTWLNQSGTHWDAAWRFPLEETKHDPVAGNGLTTLGRVDSALDHACSHKWLQRVAGNNWSLHGTTWLTVRRLLCFLLSESDRTFEREQRIPVLTVLRRDQAADDDDSVGYVRGMSLQLRSEGRSGWYIDPVAFGITVFDDDMQQSVELAGRLTWPSLKGTAVGAMRISLAPYPGIVSSGPQRILLLSGNSAGGLTGCGLYALAHNVPLTEGLTASVGLRLKKGMTLTPGLTVTERNIDCVGVGGASPKLMSAACAGLKGVAIHSDNEAEAKAFRKTSHAAHCLPEITNTFSDLYAFLTHGFNINLVIGDHAGQIARDWKNARQGGALEGESHRLDVFVKPQLSVLQKQTDNREATERWRKLPAGVQRLIDEYLIPGGRWLIITEDAGGGKTVLSWYLRAALSRHSHRFWVVRYEGAFPDDLRSDLQAQLAHRLQQRGIDQKPKSVLDDLLKQGRVVVIYDALDQDNSDKAAERIHQLRHQHSDELLAKQLRLVVTSRPYAVNQQHTRIFGRQEWQHCKLELFDEPQQEDYRQQMVRLWEDRKGWGSRVEDLYRQIIPDREAIADLLPYPVVQWLIRTIIEATLNDNPAAALRPFRNAGDLYWEVSHRLLDRAFKSGRFTQQPGDIALLFEGIACYGYEMMLRYRDYRVPSGDIPVVKRSVRQRFSGTDGEWDRCSKILRETYLTEHLLLKENREQELSFPSLKMLEFFTAVYLARYASSSVVSELTPHIGDEKWNNVWRFVAELPETTDQDGQPASRADSLRHSLQVLFSVPQQKTRPAESMFRAWQVLARNEYLSDVLHEVMEGYRHQFRRLLIEMDEDAQPASTALTAAEVLLEDDLREFVTQAVDREMVLIDTELQKLDTIKRRTRAEQSTLTNLERRYETLQDFPIDNWWDRIKPKSRAYALCSDEKKNGNSDRLTFSMGASPEDQHARENEKPWQPVDLPAFYMATGCVTRAQYRLFDPQREYAHAEQFKSRAPYDECPMIEVDFYDSFCFALILGDRYTLPSECEWEGAAWGGINRQKHQDYVIGIPPFDASFTSQHVNFDGNHPLDGKKSEYRERTLPVRHNAFGVNGFGLWQMHGNVWEWCRSEWHGELKDAVGHRNDATAKTSAASARCVRGGSWFINARNCRASFRNWFDADDRYGDAGFRLSRTK